jgi:2-C-methyl-D-erythritol 2,4-cyclodiphosphate synthase
VRVGIGYDVHRLAPGRRLVLGGVEIEYARGLEGHSDADVLTHAVIDALLGAAALGTIGEHFPDSDERYRDASSLTLLDATMDAVNAAGHSVGNLDAVIVAQEPRLQAHLRAMAECLAGHLRVAAPAVSVKATSPEAIGSLGRGDAIAAHAVVLLERAE